MNGAKPVSLYSRTEELAELYNRLAATGGDLSEEINGKSIEEEIERHQLLHREKIDGLCWVITNLEADAEMCKNHARRLMDRAKSRQGRVDALKDAMRDSMRRLGILKVEAPEHTVFLQRNGKAPLEVMAPIEELPEHFIRTEIVRTVDKEALRAALEKGDPEAGKYARLGLTTESVRIK